MKKGIYLNDSIHGLILMSEYEKRIISSVGFNRLHDVYQNSTVYLTFPTNRTKRFEHSIGTMKLCSDMFFCSVLNATPEDLIKFYNIFLEEYDNIICGIAENPYFCELKLGGRSPDKIPQIKFDKYSHSLIPHNVPEKYQTIHLLLIQSIRVAALLHDIGHPPFSHIVEDALKTVYEECKDLKPETGTKLNIFLETMSKYFEDNKKLHEQMGNEISDSILTNVLHGIDDEDEGYDENLFESLVLESVKNIFREKKPFSYLHRIIDSSLDGDRLDYVTRDSLNSGMNSGRIDYNRIINEMRLIIDNDEIFFCVPLKAVNSVEDFIKRRYNIYKDIIHHHRVIKTDYLLEHTVRDLVKKYLQSSSECEDHYNKVLIPFDISGLWFPLGKGTSSEKSNALSQWNDSWLMTLLKQIYYTEYYRNETINIGTDEYILKQMLSELLLNKKCYYSLIKRSENFKLIDDAVKEVFAENREQIEDLVTRTNELSSSLNLTTISEVTTVDIKGTLDFIEEILSCTTNTTKGFVMSYVSGRYKAIKIDSFESFIKQIVEQETKDAFANTAFYDVIVVMRNISIGLDNPIYFFDYNGKICTLDEISGVSKILRLDSDYLPVFNIYVLVKDGDDIVREKREEVLESIGKKIGFNLTGKIVEVLKLQIKQMEENLCAK